MNERIETKVRREAADSASFDGAKCWGIGGGNCDREVTMSISIDPAMLTDVVLDPAIIKAYGCDLHRNAIEASYIAIIAEVVSEHSARSWSQDVSCYGTPFSECDRTDKLSLVDIEDTRGAKVDGHWPIVASLVFCPEHLQEGGKIAQLSARLAYTSDTKEAVMTRALLLRSVAIHMDDERTNGSYVLGSDERN